VLVRRLELFILISLAIAALVVLAGAGLMLADSIGREPIPTLPLATVPPHPLLLTRVPVCQDVVGRALAAHGWENTVLLDPQRALLTIEVAAATEPTGLPADQIWAAFEAALAGRAGGCLGYTLLVVHVDRYRAAVGVDDLSAWEAGALDDGAFGERVELSQEEAQ
jgi:hypothetical protein